MPIERLVALTFTNKAAGEIKQRLASRLSDLLVYKTLTDPKRQAEAQERLKDARERFGRTEGQVQAAAQEAISGMARAMIGTIHHFAALVLKRYPLEAGVDPGFQVDMGEGFADLFETEWNIWLAQELGERAPREAAWLEVLRLASIEDLTQLARDLCQDKVRFENIGLSPEMKAQARRVVDGFTPLTRIGVPPGGSSKIREHLAELKPRMESIARVLDEPLPIPAEREALLSKAKTWPKAWSAQAGESEYQRCCELASATSGLQESLVAKSVSLVLPFARRFRELYRRRGLVSNDGLILGVWALVLKDFAVREELKGAYDAFLIDEFQDTDPAQGEMLLLLAEKKGGFAPSWRKVEFAPGKLFIVGDPKQSIYRFRGADMRAYDGFKDLLKSQGAQTCRLRRSFRSHEGIVAPVNAVFSQLMEGEPGLQPEYADIIPSAAGEGGPPRTRLILFHDSSAAKNLKADDAREAEAAWIAARIAAHHGPDRPYKDMALLLRKTTSLEIYLQALKDKGIPYAVEADKYFYGAQEILDFTNLLRVLDDSEDRAAAVGLMRSPLLGLTDQEIYGLARAKCLSLDRTPPASAGLSARSLSLLGDLGRMAARLRTFAGREPLDEFVSRVLGETFLLELCAAAYHHEQTAANLGKYRRLARRANESRGATLKEFIAEVVRSMGDDSLQEGESPLADEQFDAVRILSIHKAKGLEYGTVFVADMGGRTSRGGGGKATCRVDWGSGRVGLRLEKSRAADLAMTFIEQGEKAREEAEALRLLYVAMTRAKDELYLLGSAAPGSSASFSEFLLRVDGWPAKDSLKPLADFKPNEKLGLGFELRDLARPGAADAVAATAAREEPVLDGKALAEAWSGRFDEGKGLAASHVFTSPTAYLKEAPKTGLTEESEPPARAGGVRSREDAALVGELCHRVLERWDYAVPGDLDALLARAGTALARRHPSASWDGLSAEAREILNGFFSTPAARELAGCEILGREVPFVFPREGKVVRGSIDLLCRRDGKLWVVDYKTDARRKKTAKSSAYRRQGAAYVEAVRRSLGEEAGFKLIHLRDGVVEEVPLAGAT
ncbi:MAG: hypothetical protein A2V88_16930 [Elusimicrobia bacterium RBG_16_66_12]|nr:MAG: hypothetical protein A2V88_16930 [Elusimicrobia bacterium RBG_16_66_12]